MILTNDFICKLQELFGFKRFESMDSFEGIFCVGYSELRIPTNLLYTLAKSEICVKKE